MNEKVLREVQQNLPERSARDKHLPWDNPSIINDPELPPEGCGLESVCAKGAVAFTTRRVGINATASRQIVCARCGGGRRPSANAFTGDCEPIENATPRQRLNDGETGRHRGQDAMRWPSRRRSYRSDRTARGHAARSFLPNSVTDLDAMNHCLATRVPRHGTAVMTVGRPCGELLTVNVSG